jgi:hypothetical protein
MIREENRVSKQEIDQIENKFSEAKDKIRRKENEKLTCEKILADFNQNKQMIQSQTASKME